MSGIYRGRVDIPARLPKVLHYAHDNQPCRAQQSVRNGTQFNLRPLMQFKAVSRLIRSLASEITNYAGRDWRYEGAWSTRLVLDGFHVAHNHPEGWISGVCYIEVPKDSAKLTFLDGNDIEPMAGDVVLFPSTLIHATTCHNSTSPRLTVAFDLTDASCRPFTNTFAQYAAASAMNSER